MVYALVVHSATPSLNGQVTSSAERDGSVAPESVDVYFSFFYEKIVGLESDRVAQAIATLVAKALWQQNEYNRPFQPKPVAGGARNQPLPQSPAKTSGKQEKESRVDGMFYLKPIEGVQTPKIVLWRQQDSIIFTIVCYLDENRLLAGQFLKALPRYLSEQLKSSSPSISARELFSRPDDFLVVLHQYLPGGQLLFMSDDFERQLKRESDAAAPKS